MKRILCLGDSNTFGYDPRSYFGSQYPPEVRWTGLLERKGWTIFNCGQNGLSIPRSASFPLLARLVREKQPLSAVTVMLGSNDLLQGASSGESVQRMEALLRFLLEQTEEAPILLIAPPPMELGEWVPGRALIEQSVLLAEAYRSLAQELEIPFADAGEWGIELCFDGVHFSPQGHAAFARGLSAFLETLPEVVADQAET